MWIYTQCIVYLSLFFEFKVIKQKIPVHILKNRYMKKIEEMAINQWNKIIFNQNIAFFLIFNVSLFAMKISTADKGMLYKIEYFW